MKRASIQILLTLVTQYGDHVTDQDAEDDEDHGYAMDGVQESNAVGSTQRNPHSSVGSLLI